MGSTASFTCSEAQVEAWNLLQQQGLDPTTAAATVLWVTLETDRSPLDVIREALNEGEAV